MVRHNRVVRLIHQTPVTTVADLVQSLTARADLAAPTHAAVQGCVVARETTRLTAPITGSSCVAYKVRVYVPSDDYEVPDENYIEDSKWVPWAINDSTGLALASFDPLRPNPAALHNYWPGRTTTGDTFRDNTPHPLSILPGQAREDSSPSPLDRVISHYGYQRLPAERWYRSHQDLSWEVSILKEYRDEVFLLGPCTVQEGCAHFRVDSDSLFWFGSRSDALSHFQQRAQSSSRWVVIWLTVSVILAVVYLLFG
jgi:hypothetical protein